MTKPQAVIVVVTVFFLVCMIVYWSILYENERRRANNMFSMEEIEQVAEECYDMFYEHYGDSLFVEKSRESIDDIASLVAGRIVWELEKKRSMRFLHR